MASLCGVNVHVLPAGPIETNAYLLTEPATGEAILIDAPDGVWAPVERLLRAENCRLVGLWLTHGHWDHTQGAAEVVRRTGARVLAHRDGRRLIETPEVMRALLMPGLVVEPAKVDQWIDDGQTVDALGESVRVGHVPGHCPGSLMFYFPRLGAAFVGDALFRGGVGRTDLPGGDFAELERSIRSRIYTLPESTTVYSGHGEPTSVGEEKAHNPYVSA
jgi:glyoxylase-like metal-dependent hydrolase (beta-lactamase superfamily II)